MWNTRSQTFIKNETLFLPQHKYCFVYACLIVLFPFDSHLLLFHTLSFVPVDPELCQTHQKFTKGTQTHTQIEENIPTHRTCNVYNTSGSCRYDNAVKSFCPINIAGFRRNGRSLSDLISIVRLSPASVTICNFLSFSLKLSLNVAPSQTVVGLDIQIRAPYVMKRHRSHTY